MWRATLCQFEISVVLLSQLGELLLASEVLAGETSVGSDHAEPWIIWQAAKKHFFKTVDAKQSGYVTCCLALSSMIWLFFLFVSVRLLFGKQHHVEKHEVLAVFAVFLCSARSVLESVWQVVVAGCRWLAAGWPAAGTV